MSSLEAGQWVDEEPYEMVDFSPAVRSLRNVVLCRTYVVLCRARVSLSNNCRILSYICRSLSYTCRSFLYILHMS